MSKKRIEVISKMADKENLDGVIVNHMDHIRYISGFTGSSGLLVISGKSADFITDFRYKDQAGKQVKGARVSIKPGIPLTSLKDFPKYTKKNLKFGYNPEFLSISNLEALRVSLPEAIFIPVGSMFTELGWIKDKEEIANIAKAAKIADTAFERILKMVVPGVSENELCAELEYQMRMLGSEKPAFETIIASGWRSALPHGVASMKKIKKGDFITFDFGATVNGYVSDMTRTVVCGKATARQKKIYNLVLKAQVAGIKKIKAGIDASKVDKACRDIITKGGHGKNFGHGTGHGIGYFVHVGPRLSPISKDKLLVNNVVTVEPGIYISGWGGVRIEDDIVVTRNGGKVLNKAPKKLLEL